MIGKDMRHIGILIIVLLVSLGIVSCMPKQVALRHDPEFARIAALSRNMDKATAVESIQSFFLQTYTPEQVEVTESGYGIRSHPPGQLTIFGSGNEGRVVVLHTGSEDFDVEVKFANVKDITTSRWGAVDDAIAFGREKRWTINLMMSDPQGKYKHNTSSRFICYEKDKDQLLVALVTLCPNLRTQ